MLKRSKSSESLTCSADLLNRANLAEQQSVAEILLLLKQLVQHESTTVKLILDRLYDIGTNNLIDQKTSWKTLNRFSKAIATQSKPFFRFVGIHWFQHNCPKLATDWLYEQVQFQPSTQASELLEIVVSPPENLVPDECSREVQKLRSKLRWRTGWLCGALGITGSLLAASHTVLSSPPLPTPPTASQITGQSFKSLN